MRRRDFLMTFGAAVLLAPPALAQTAQDQVMSQLRQQGYGNIAVTRTFLGRIRFVADGPAGRREIILNPATGIILRDYVDRSVSAGNGGAVGGRQKDGERDPGPEGDDNSGPGGGDDDEADDDNSGPGGGDDDETDDDHSGPGGGDDSKEKDDHSGPGGGHDD